MVKTNRSTLQHYTVLYKGLFDVFLLQLSADYAYG